MAKLIYSVIESLDGYVADENGNFDWAEPDEEVHAFVNDLERPVGTYLYGRRMYEVMNAWETMEVADQPAFIQDFAAMWRAADKIVYSRTLEKAESAKTRIERDLDPEAVRQLKASFEADISIGGPNLAAKAMRTGLVDEWHLLVAPVVVGGGARSFPDNVRLGLELVDRTSVRQRHGLPALRHEEVLIGLAVLIDELRVEPGRPPGLMARDTRATFGLDKAAGREKLKELVERVSILQQRLFAEHERSLLLVLQGLDASGKDGVIRKVFTGVNPQGCRVVSFKAPTSTELAHDFLWRIHAALPERGYIGVFNRSHYEDIVTVRMLGLVPEEVWKRRPGDVNAFERTLVDEGTTIVKVFLNVSKEEQAERFRERIADPEKRWKFRKADLETHKRFAEYMSAYDEAIEATSKRWAPWHVVPADRNWVKSLAVAALVVDALERMDPKLPDPEPGIET